MEQEVKFWGDKIFKNVFYLKNTKERRWKMKLTAVLIKYSNTQIN